MVLAESKEEWGREQPRGSGNLNETVGAWPWGQCTQLSSGLGKGSVWVEIAGGGNEQFF